MRIDRKQGKNQLSFVGRLGLFARRLRNMMTDSSSSDSLFYGELLNVNVFCYFYCFFFYFRILWISDIFCQGIYVIDDKWKSFPASLLLEHKLCVYLVLL